ncbi:MAG TPA: ATP-dependent DNA ligase [Flavipsychrobacter sp.]|nr:ATP-dependent DNA ligase [Flavipsychrobacter sp.]
MKAFNKLFQAIDQTTSTNEKTEALAKYLRESEAADAIWTVALLMGKRPKRTVRSGELRTWCSEESNTPVWLLEESYHVVGDLAETIALLLPGRTTNKDVALHDIMQDLISLNDKTDEERKNYILHMWRMLPHEQLFVFNKLITGSFRVGVSSKIVVKALAKVFGKTDNVIAHSLSGNWDPATVTLHELLDEQRFSEDSSKPYPFYLAYALDTEAEALGDVQDWIIERKYDGIRGQLIVRKGNLFVWSRGEDLLTEKFVEFHGLAKQLPDGTVIDGEILPILDGNILPFHVMQTRIGRKNLSAKALKEAPLSMVCYDLLEYHGTDIRHEPLHERRNKLIALLEEVKKQTIASPLQLSPEFPAANWEAVARERMAARDYGCEGLMLKRKDSFYKTGRKKGDWWKWKVDPLSVDGVLIYAQRGHGRRANLYTDFTFAVWDGDVLVPFTKAYSGLTDKELLEVDTWIKRHTLDKFGPVRSVTPQLVFEIAFEGIQRSSRHKSGVALRFPRISRWRQDKDAGEANTKEDLMQLLEVTR